MRGADKLLEIVDGVPVLLRQARAALASGATVVVCLPTDRPRRDAVLAGLGVKRVRVDDAEEGMAASIRAGVRAVPRGATGAMILPADMPEIDADDLSRMLTAFTAAGRTGIVRGMSETGDPGHPVVFPRRLFPDLAALSGDEGARRLCEGEKVELVRLPGTHALTDLDTPEDWAAWRKARAAGQRPTSPGHRRPR